MTGLTPIPRQRLESQLGDCFRDALSRGSSLNSIIGHASKRTAIPGAQLHLLVEASEETPSLWDLQTRLSC